MLKSRRPRAAAALAALVTVAVVPAIGAEAAPGNGQGHAYGRAKHAVAVSPLDSYLVVMEAEPLLGSFDQADLQSGAARQQAGELAASHDAALAAVGAAPDTKTYSYTNAVNGFAANISNAQAEKLTGVAGVAMVVPNELQQATTDESGTFLGLNAPGGAYAAGLTGEGVVIGVIDSGIWPEHPSFADDLDGDGVSDYDAAPITIGEVTADDYLGIKRTWEPCAFGNTEHELAEGLEDLDFACNNKLIGARWVLDSYVENVGLSDVEYASARDENGHGTHTASTAGGNAGVAASIFGIDRGEVTGIAPRAHVVAYKALGELGGTSADLAMAIDLAVYDGVDVINYSIGSSSFAVGVDDVAFLYAAAEGVHVATSNGNSGPGPATTGSPSSVPWLTSVGASTHSRTFQGSVTIHQAPSRGRGNAPTPVIPGLPPVSASGASVTEGSELVPIVDAASLGNELCLSHVPFKKSIKGKIVLCRRGENARVDKSLAVGLGGGVGMVLYNLTDNDNLVTDNHWVPSVHVNYTDGMALKAAIKANAVAQITGGEVTPAQANVMAAFSSRGPNRLTSDIIKPDVTAPGVNILAGNTPTPTTGRPGQLFQSISGTSMSSPHVAGLLALFDQQNPAWSAAAAKSALMTTARQDVVKENGSTPADPFDMGAGHVDPSGSPDALGGFFNPGIVYPAGFNDYLAFICGAGLGLVGPATCTALANAGFSLDPSDLNLASIAVGELPGTQTVRRRVTNVSAEALTLTPSIEAPEGYAVTVQPATISVAAGATATFQVTISNVSGPIGEWAFGSLTLEGSGVSAYSPIAVRGVALSAPPVVSGTIADGGTSFEVNFGYTGEYAAVPHGLTPATVVNGSVGQDPDQTFQPTDVGNGATAHTIDVVDAAMLRIHIPPLTNAAIDLDLFVFGPDGSLVGQSTNGSTNETVDVVLPADGTYTAYVHGWSVGDTPVTYEFDSWVVPYPPGNMTADAPTTATIGTTGTVTLTWPADLKSGAYLGLVTHESATAVEGVTIVDVHG